MSGMLLAHAWWFPPPISRFGQAYDAQFARTLVTAGIILIVAQFALGYAIVRFRKNGRPARHSHGSNRVEALWITAAAVLFLALAAMGSRTWADVHFGVPPPDAISIEVLSRQFTWSFRYPG